MNIPISNTVILKSAFWRASPLTRNEMRLAGKDSQKHYLIQRRASFPKLTRFDLTNGVIA